MNSFKIVHVTIATVHLVNYIAYKCCISNSSSGVPNISTVSTSLYRLCSSVAFLIEVQKVSTNVTSWTHCRILTWAWPLYLLRTSCTFLSSMITIFRFLQRDVCQPAKFEIHLGFETRQQYLFIFWTISFRATHTLLQLLLVEGTNQSTKRSSLQRYSR